eukprot:5954161-Amphidinium_carterae.1
MLRWTEWGNAINKHQRVHVNQRPSLDWQQSMWRRRLGFNGWQRTSELALQLSCRCAPLRMNGW